MSQPLTLEGYTYNGASVTKDDVMPMLRFEEVTMEDRAETIRTEKKSHKDAHLVTVFVDVKTEVPHLVWYRKSVPISETVMVSKKMPIIQQDGKGNETTIYRTQEVPEERVKYEEEDAFPWFDKLTERLGNGQITEKYVEYCKTAYEGWKKHGNVPVDGIPVSSWEGITPAHRANLLESGINTIERVAAMTEDQMETVGMGARDLKGKAIKFLQNSDSDKLQKLEVSLAEERKETQGLKAKLEELEKMIEKPKRGRPPKVKENVSVNHDSEGNP